MADRPVSTLPADQDHPPTGLLAADAAIFEPCALCGHPPGWHRLDDSTNVAPTSPEAMFRCLGYDCEAAGPLPAGGRACDCPDYVGPNEVAMLRAEVAMLRAEVAELLDHTRGVSAILAQALGHKRVRHFLGL